MFHHEIQKCQTYLKWNVKRVHALMDRAYYTPNLKLACFVCYLKIANIFFFFEM